MKNQPESEETNGQQLCPICDKPFSPNDLCAEDISEGTCHATCVEGSPVVDLETGEELPDGEVHTFRFSEVMDPPAPTSSDNWTRWQGGGMPVTEGTAVEVILRYGKQALAQAGSGYASRWSYDSRHGDHDDIVFYRLAHPSPETHVSGVNEGIDRAAALVEQMFDEDGFPMAERGRIASGIRALAREVVTNHGSKRGLHPEYVTAAGTDHGDKSTLYPGFVPSAGDA